MKISTPRKIRLYIKVVVDGETFASTIKSRVFDFVKSHPAPKGTCTVIYDSKTGLTNEFEFDGEQDFLNSLMACTEMPLLKYIAEKPW